jgi:hypothetical protein
MATRIFQVSCPKCGLNAPFKYTQKNSGEMISCKGCGLAYRALDELEKAIHKKMVAGGYTGPAPRPNPSGPIQTKFSSKAVTKAKERSR